MTEQSRNRVYLAIIVVLLLIIVGAAWKLIVAGSTQAAPDARTSVLLTPGERALVLREMRGFVAGLQQIADALARDDMQGVSAASRAMGTAAAHEVPLALLGKLPLDFKRLAFGVHHGFDAIAEDAATLRDSKRTLGQLSAVMKQCVECHERYEVSRNAASP